MTDILKGETIVYFGPERWDGLWRNRHQLMSRFASHNNVWYVEPPITLRQLIAGKKRNNNPVKVHRSRLCSRDATGVRIFHSPWWLPITGRPPLKNFSIRLYLGVLSLAARLHKRRPIVWLSRPGMIEYLDKVPAKLTIYHVVDEYSGYGSPSTEAGESLADKEAELLRRVDIVMVVTEALLRSKSPHNPNTHQVPNAVDFIAYADCDSSVPDDMAAIPGPIIGYSGLIAARLDLELVQAAAESRPEWSYVFVGAVRDDDCRTQMRRLYGLPNVHFLGRKSVSETPAYVRHFDVGMIPYTVNLRAQHASPLKLYEYAAASKPIVATDFAAARDFEGYIEIVHDKDEFIEACERCLAAGSTSAAIVENHRFAADNTWEHRVKQVSRIIRSCTNCDS